MWQQPLIQINPLYIVLKSMDGLPELWPGGEKFVDVPRVAQRSREYRSEIFDTCHSLKLGEGEPYVLFGLFGE